MKGIFRSWALTVSLAIAGCFGSTIALAEPLTHAIRVLAESSHSVRTVEFQAQLAQAYAGGDTSTAVRSDLHREGHGYRMKGAEDYEGFAPLS